MKVKSALIPLLFMFFTTTVQAEDGFVSTPTPGNNMIMWLSVVCVAILAITVLTQSKRRI